MLKDYLKQFGDVTIEFSKIGRSYYQIPKQLQDTVNTIKQDTQYVGLLLATEKQKELIISPNLLNIIAKQTHQKIILDGKTAWLFICGRDIFPENIEDIPKGKGPFIVENEQGEVLGLAQKAKKQFKTMYENILDIGIYNRREK